MSVLPLERLSAILGCWALMGLSTSSPTRRSEVTDACDRLLWEEWLPLSERLLKGILGWKKTSICIIYLKIIMPYLSYLKLLYVQLFTLI